MAENKVAIIPARGGSKRIPRKNIRIFHNKPIIARSIEAAVDSGCFERVIVSTDDKEIAAVANHYGAETPYSRHHDLADDLTPVTPVIVSVLENLIQDGFRPDAVCCIFATAPFIDPIDLEKSGDLLHSTGAEFVLPITSYPFPIQRAVRLIDENRLAMIEPENFNVRSQDLEEAYHDAGQFCWGRTQAWLSGYPVYSSVTAVYPLPRYKVQDIDTEEDWATAELLFAALDAKA